MWVGGVGAASQPAAACPAGVPINRFAHCALCSPPQVRYDKRVGDNTAIKFMTDGILLR